MHKVVWKDKTKFSDIIPEYKSFSFSHYSRTTSIIFDGNDETFRNVMSYERLRRATKKVAPEISFGMDMELIEKKDVFLSNVKNKSRFITILKSALVSETNLSIKQARKDADSLIIKTEIDLAEKHLELKIVLVGNDIDVILSALMVALTASHLNIVIWKPRASLKTRYNL